MERYAEIEALCPGPAAGDSNNLARVRVLRTRLMLELIVKLLAHNGGERENFPYRNWATGSRLRCC